MTKHYLRKPIYSLMLVFTLLASCNGQTKTQLETVRVNATSTVPTEYPKMLRTQGVGYTQVSCGFQDDAGNLWFGTLNEGVYCFDGKTFVQFTTKDGLGDNTVNAITENNTGNILIGTNKGIYNYDGNKFHNYFETDSLKKLNITSLLEDRNGSLWFGVMNNGIYRYDGTSISKVLYQYKHPFYGDKYENYIDDIIQDKKGNIWFSSWNGGGAWKYNGKNFTNFLPSRNYYLSNEDGRKVSNSQNTFEYNPNTVYTPTQDNITDDMIFSMMEDKAGNIWFATRRHGACRFDGKSFKSFGESQGFVSRGIYSILEDKKGNIWFTTEDNGVWYYDGKTFKNYTTADGLVNNSVWFVIQDKHGNLWFGTRGFGLSRYDGKTFITFSDYKE
jgi:ligand-binding sensor domain-containing protein